MLIYLSLGLRPDDLVYLQAMISASLELREPSLIMALMLLPGRGVSNHPGWCRGAGGGLPGMSLRISFSRRGCRKIRVFSMHMPCFGKLICFGANKHKHLCKVKAGSK